MVPVEAQLRHFVFSPVFYSILFSNKNILYPITLSNTHNYIIRKLVDCLTKTVNQLYLIKKTLHYGAANTSLYYTTYFRDGESLTVFAVDWDMRESLMKQIETKADWHIASVTAQDYQQVAERFRTPASMLRPSDDIVFDAFFYEDILQSDASRFSVNSGKVFPNLWG